MYIEYTKEELQERERIKQEYAVRIANMSKSDDQGQLVILQMQDELEAYNEKCQADRFNKFADDPNAILKNAQEQTDLILNYTYNNLVNNLIPEDYKIIEDAEIGKIIDDKLYLQAEFAVDLLKNELKLHRHALLKDPHRLQKLRDIIIKGIEKCDFTIGSLSLDIIDALEVSVIYKKYYKIKHSPITDLITRSLTQNALQSMDGDSSIVPFDQASFLLTTYGGFDKFTIGADKLYQAGVAELTKQNPGRGKADNVEVEVKIPFRKFASFNYDIEVHPVPESITDPAKIKEFEDKERKRVKEALKTARKRIGKDLKILLKTSLSWDDKEGPVAGLNILQDFTIGPTDGYITLTFTNRLASYLLNQPISQRPTALFYLGAKDINSYNIGCKIADQYSNYTNIANERNDRLKVKTLLAVTSLPTMESLQDEHGRNNSRQWYSRIKEPFEAALDKLTGLTIKNWEYVKEKGEPLTEEEAYNITDYETFINLHVKFEPLNEPDLTGAEKVKEAKKAKQERKKRTTKTRKKASK